MADKNNNKNLPIAIIHRVPTFQFDLTCFSGICTPVEPSDPSHHTHQPSARVILAIGPIPLTSAQMGHYPSLECVIGTSAGVNRIDLDELLSASDRYVRTGLWPRNGFYPLGNSLGGKRVGIVGLGSIGTLIAKRLEPFGCTIAYNSRKKKAQLPYTFYSTVLDLATNSDALIVCCPLTNKTRHIINRDVLKALGNTGVLVNIGRGGLVDENELVKLLVGREIRGAGLDVFENEPERGSDAELKSLFFKCSIAV
nr:glyoxylate/hydroxypyruvate reductase HPR3 [Tanacetum cinerariifolium]